MIKDPAREGGVTEGMGGMDVVETGADMNVLLSELNATSVDEETLEEGRVSDACAPTEARLTEVRGNAVDGGAGVVEAPVTLSDLIISAAYNVILVSGSQ